LAIEDTAMNDSTGATSGGLQVAMQSQLPHFSSHIIFCSVFLKTGENLCNKVLLYSSCKCRVMLIPCRNSRCGDLSAGLSTWRLVCRQSGEFL